MMCKLKGRMNKVGHYDVKMKGCMQKGGIIMCKLKGRMDKGEHYQVEIMDGKGGIMMCKLKGRMDKGHYDVQIMRWMQKVAL